MKITTNKIIRELKKKGYNETFLLKSVDRNLITDIRDVIDEILRIHKNITINGK
jgi:hypothetical protein